MNGFGDSMEIENTRKQIEDEFKVQCVYSDADMLNVGQIEDLVNGTFDQFGRLDVVVNNAGIQHVSKIEEFPVEKYDQIIGINMNSNFHTIRAAVPLMKKQGGGRIINVASAHALTASPFKSAYVAAKHGVLGLTKAAALEVATFNITVNAICPGYVLTPLVENQIADTAKARGISEEEVVQDVMLERQPTKKFVTIEEVAATAVFLASKNSASITGTSISVDGGWVAQ